MLAGRLLFLCLAACLAAATPLLAQSQAINGSIEGTIKDASGAVLPGVTVTVHHVQTGSERVVVTNTSGVFRAPLLPLGTFNVSAGLVGFKTYEQSGIELRAGATLVLNLVMEVGNLTEVLQVTADAPTVDLGKTDVGRNLTSREITNLPNVARNPYNFALLEAGVTGFENEEFGVPRFAVNGQMLRVNYQIDGNTNTQSDRAGLRLMPISEVMIQEVQIVSAGYAPEFGQTTGMVYNAVTPSGTNAHKGDVGYRFRRKDFSAWPFDADAEERADPANKPDNSLDIVTATLGGPILKNKLFYYAGFEYTKQQLPRLVTIDPELARQVGLAEQPFSVASYRATPFYIGKIDYQITGAHRLSLRTNTFTNHNPYQSGGRNTAIERGNDFKDFMLSSAGQLVSTFGNNNLNELRVQVARRRTTRPPSDPSTTGPSVTIEGTTTQGGVSFGPYTGIGGAGGCPRRPVHTVPSMRLNRFAFGAPAVLACGLLALAPTTPAALTARQITTAPARARLPITVERHAEGAPLTFGVPFPKGALASPDQVRVLSPDGREVPSQVTEVTTWEPADPSIKWVWVFFFAGAGDRYVLEYGTDVRRAIEPRGLQVVNNQRDGGLLEVTTGPLRFVVQQGDTGFLKSVALDLEGNGFDGGDVIAEGPASRGSFVDLLDDAGLDASQATITQTFIERGSGPLHAVLRIEGEYRYARPDNNPAPFVMRIHAYAGRPFVRVLHTFVYTGVPDQHRPRAGDYAHLATQAGDLITPDPADTGWSVPNDRIQGAGLRLDLKLDAARRATLGWRDGAWWDAGTRRTWTRRVGDKGTLALVQSGPKPDRIPPVPESTPTARVSGFSAELSAMGGQPAERAERAEGWMDVSDARRGVAIGIRHFLEEYPKELRLDPSGEAQAFTWSPRGGAMSFARSSAAPGSEGAVENWAQGLAKTSELIVLFHGAGTADADLARTMGYVLDPPVAHVEPAWYGETGVYGHFAPRSDAFPEYQRALDYKFDWVLFNQRWMPWYGMFDYGDVKVSFNGTRWDNWGHNEPAQDYEIWLQFMRTGDARYFDAAQALSRHTMDVDNTHWPSGPHYRGDSNYPLDYWNSLKIEPATKWLGIGRRHSAQHWQHALSAHVWVQGWMANYYLAADHRALDVAKQTADMHLRRLWGDHELTGRRLYLSVWNLAEVWDATKDARYGDEVKARVGRMLALQFEQGGSLTLDRYGYAQIYASHGLSRYLSMTGDSAARTAIVRHARFVRDVPPLNHWMESYYSSIHSLALAYELTAEPSFLAETKRRIADMRTDALDRPIDDSWTQQALFEAYENVSHLPPDPNRHRPPASGRARGGSGRGAATFASPGSARRPGWSPTHGLRIFGWTHAYTLPYALAVIQPAAPITADGAAREIPRD